jgi:hypothetical protein
VRLAAAHRLREIKGAILTLAGEAFEPASDQQLEAGREIIPLKEGASSDPVRRKILDLRDLFNEAIAFHDSARDTQLLYGRYRHLARFIVLSEKMLMHSTRRLDRSLAAGLRQLPDTEVMDQMRRSGARCVNKSPKGKETRIFFKYLAQALARA